MSPIAYRRRDGFSLIEMMAVLVILAIASAIVLPQLGNLDDLKVASATRELVADLSYAQSRAVATGNPVYVHFDAGRQCYALQESIAPEKVILHPSTGLAFEVKLGAGALRGVNLRSAQFNGRKIVAFDAMGAPFSYEGENAPLRPLSEGTIVLGSGDFTQAVSIQPITGAIKVH